MRIWLLRSLIGGLLFAADLALADEAQVKRTLNTRLPGTVIGNVVRTPIAGFYEVQVDGEIVYTDEKAEYFFSGNIFDITVSSGGPSANCASSCSICGVASATRRASSACLM